MNKKLWEASKKLKNNSNLFKFEKFISNKYNKNFSKDFEKIHKWSVSNSHNFWNSVWDFTSVKGAKNNQKPKKSSKFYKNIFWMIGGLMELSCKASLRVIASCISVV